MNTLMVIPIGQPVGTWIMPLLKPISKNPPASLQKDWGRVS
ncbi:MAG TPA: hypothetical protein VKV19_13515 [Ktedonobacteraceae bacterium]|nr:hypothetical protein [Ktedonobacteraceae bacterium]